MFTPRSDIPVSSANSPIRQTGSSSSAARSAGVVWDGGGVVLAVTIALVAVVVAVALVRAGAVLRVEAWAAQG